MLQVPMKEDPVRGTYCKISRNCSLKNEHYERFAEFIKLDVNRARNDHPGS